MGITRVADRRAIVAPGSPSAIACAVLRNETVQWIDGTDPAAIQRFIGATRYHGVLPLLDCEFASREGFETWPREIVGACHKTRLVQAMHELAQRAENKRVVDALAAAGVMPLLLKGSALAYSHYPNPTLRPRGDTDLLIPLDRRKETDRVLAALGYTKSGGVEGELVSYQATWSRGVEKKGIAHHFDVHWRINNSQILAKLFSYDELAARAVPLPALGEHARTLAPIDALLFACIHRAGHANAPYYVDNIPYFGDRAIWLYDMHLLYLRMSDAEQEEFVARAVSKQIKAICRDALQRTIACFGTPIPQRIVDALNAPGAAEPSARYLSGGRVRQMIGDLLAFDSWRDRGKWLAEHAFPSENYMRGKYPNAVETPLLVLYLRRMGAGLVRLFVARRLGDDH